MIAYVVKKNQGIITLQANEAPMVCPFALSLPVQDNLGQLKYSQSPCTSRCPSFEILKKPQGAERVSVHLHCVKRTFEYLEEKK